MSEPSLVAFPEPPQENRQDEYVKKQFDKRLDEWLAARQQTWAAAAAELAHEQETLDAAVAVDDARDDADVAAEIASLAAIEAAYIATAQATLDRALTRANFLTASVSTVITLYTALLAFIYTTADTGTGGDTGVDEQPLQVVALVPALFLGLALLLVTVYAAVLRKKTTVGPFLPTGIGGQIQELRLVTYLRWCFDPVLARRSALHAGITSLGLGIATLPLPFVNAGPEFQAGVFIVGLGAVGVTAAWSEWGDRVLAKVDGQ